MSLSSLSRQWLILRRSLKSALPYVRSRVHRRLQDKYDLLTSTLASGAGPATQASWTERKPLASTLAGEVCLFVSHAAKPALKPHIHVHLRSLMQQGVAVILLINTDLPHQEIEIDPDLQRDLAACYIRSNLGFDFAIWSHALNHCAAGLAPTRLYLINDSIIGPVDQVAFQNLIERIRRTDYDVLGLTEHYSPRHHLQSYFLCFGPRALVNPIFRKFFLNIFNLPTKELVIDTYETRMTETLNNAGLSCHALFPSRTRSPYDLTETQKQWKTLIDAGFPYIKGSVVNELGKQNSEITARIPDNLL